MFPGATPPPTGGPPLRVTPLASRTLESRDRGPAASSAGDACGSADSAGPEPGPGPEPTDADRDPAAAVDSDNPMLQLGYTHGLHPDTLRASQQTGVGELRLGRASRGTEPVRGPNPAVAWAQQQQDGAESGKGGGWAGSREQGAGLGGRHHRAVHRVRARPTSAVPRGRVGLAGVAVGASAGRQRNARTGPVADPGFLEA